MPHRLHSAERLKSRKEIGRLFATGAETFSSYPIRILFRRVEVERGPHPVQVTFVVPKKRFKRAVDRNLLKRRMREAYRLHKEALLSAASGQRQIGMLVMYTGKEALPYAIIERKTVKLLGRVAERLI
jgi:ribonuclease P protein component